MDHESTFHDQIWFGPSDRPLCGWLHGPLAEAARGGVLLAPPLGREAFAARHALDALAKALARRGFVVLRFDYDGTGDSSGHLNDPARDRAWVNSVREGCELLSSMGLTSISGVGLRLGATLLGVAADQRNAQFTSMVLWDPCESGRSYLRELIALEGLRRENYEISSDGSVETSEAVFVSQAASEIRSLSLVTGSEPFAERTLVITRSDRSIPVKLATRLSDETVEWGTTSEHGAMFDVEYFRSAVPEETVGRIAAWLSDAPPSHDMFVRPRRTSSVVVAGDNGVGRVNERSMQIGSRKVFAIVSEPDGGAHGPWIVMMNSVGEDHTGRARTWVDLSRRWASLGLRSVRLDLSGYGETPESEGRQHRAMFDRAWLDDLYDVVQELSPDDPSNCVFIGLCSAAFVAVECALTLRARGVCAINPPAALDLLHSSEMSARSRRRALRALSAPMKRLVARHQWVAASLAQALEILPTNYFVDSLSTLIEGGTNVLVLDCDEDLTPLPRTPFFRSIDLLRVGKRRKYEVEMVPGADHALNNAAGRVRAMAILDAHILEHFAGSTQADTAPPDST
jgi:alpha-beta hydrolase superfamily lysophospholipase